MLCEIPRHGTFIETWLAFSALSLVLTMIISTWIFRHYYWRPTFEQWQRKSHPQYPAPAMVRREVLQMIRALLTATLCPALSLHLLESGWSKGYCGVGDYGVGYLVATFLMMWIVTDFYEFFYHRLGHTTRLGWKAHKPHHVFYNPTPYAVIADDALDQFVRTLPMLVFPLIMPVNMDLVFFTFTAFFYGYGAYLHSGHELRWPSAHNRWINSAFQHYLHHAKSSLNRPYHTGFFFKWWDRMFGSLYQGTCLCCVCSVARSERTEEAWKTVHKPDYTVLLRPAFWWHGDAAKAASQPV